MMGVGHGCSKDIYTADPRLPVSGVHWAPLVKSAFEVFLACPKPLGRIIGIINEQFNERSFDIT